MRDRAVPGLLQLEEGLSLEAEHIGNQVAGEHLHPVFVSHDRIVVILAGKTDLVLRRCQFFLQSDEVLVGFQVRVGLRQGEEGSQGLGQCIFDLCPLFDASLKGCRLLARLTTSSSVCRSWVA